MKALQSFPEFYLYYLKEHSKPMTRAFHFFGTFLVIMLLFYGILINWKALLFIPVAGYGFAWLSHLFIEHNKPATFSHPLWSLRADFVMFAHMISGKIREKLKEATALKEN